MRVRSTQTQGFTLIELSVVLVIIGLIVGGIMVGQSLIGAAAVRAQITQIEKFNAAANTFREKYGYLPGDITPVAVAQFGFMAGTGRTGAIGDGDGNGELDGGTDAWQQMGETLYFWEDLSTNSGLIEGAFNSSPNIHANTCSTEAQCSKFFPNAKIGMGAFVYVYSGYANMASNGSTNIGPNFFGISVLNDSDGNVGGGTVPALTVAQAYAIDKKIDDGFPTSGNVLAQYLFAGSGGNSGQEGWSTNSSTPSASTCYDTSSGKANYSISYQSGAMVNCGISFKMQAGD